MASRHEEIGELLGRTPGATREFISQCRKRARLHLIEWYELAFGGEGDGMTDEDRDWLDALARRRAPTAREP